MPADIQCPKCRTVLHVPPTPDGTLALTCPSCRRATRVRLFAACHRAPVNRFAADGAAAGDAVCFNHPDKQASAVCDACGRFLCGICRIDSNARRLCAACLLREQAAARATGRGFDGQRTRYDRLALFAVVLSPFVWFVSFAVAIYALYLTCRHWRRPLSLLPYTKWRFVVASGLSLAILAGWGVGIAYLLSR